MKKADEKTVGGLADKMAIPLLTEACGFMRKMVDCRGMADPRVFNEMQRWLILNDPEYRREQREKFDRMGYEMRCLQKGEVDD